MRKKKMPRIEKGPKDDGSRWRIVGENGYPVYQGDGLKLADAHRLVDSLVHPATLEMIVPPTEEQ